MAETKTNVNTSNQNTTLAGVPNASANMSNTSEIKPDVAPDTANAPEANAPAAEQKTDDKFSIAYIGGGIWTDQDGQMWCKEEHSGYISTKTFTKKELEKRPDIEWMVEYGSIRKTTV